MAVDTTYTTTIYTEHGGAQAHIGDGGSMAVESGGCFLLDSGGTMSMISGANLGFAGADLAVDDARRILVSEMGGTVIIAPAANDSALSVLNLPANVRTVVISGTSNMISGSFWLTSVSAGRELFLVFGGNSCSTASAHVYVSLSGCTLLCSTGLSISAFGAYWSGASLPRVLLRAIEDNVWAIVYEDGDING